MRSQDLIVPSLSCGPSTWAGRSLAWLACGQAWAGLVDESPAAATSLRLMVPGTGRKWFVGSTAGLGWAVRCGSA